MTKPFTLSVGLMLLVACGHDKKEATTLAISSIDSPASSPSAEPHLFTDKNGVIYLSWVEKIEGMHEFKYARLQDGQWSKPNRIASDSTWFVNWADYPMIATDGKGNFISHWLDKSGERTYEYDVKMSISSDSGNNWNSPFILHNDGKQAEHGFVTLVPYEDKVFVAPPCCVAL